MGISNSCAVLLLCTLVRVSTAGFSEASCNAVACTNAATFDHLCCLTFPRSGGPVRHHSKKPPKTRDPKKKEGGVVGSVLHCVAEQDLASLVLMLPHSTIFAACPLVLPLFCRSSRIAAESGDRVSESIQVILLPLSGTLPPRHLLANCRQCFGC